MAIEYNTRPNAPTDLKVAGKTCVSGSGRPYVTTPTPAFSARVSDPDGGQQSLRTRFYWWKNGQSRVDNDYREGTSANPATVNTASIPAGKQLQDSQIYTVQAHIWDDVGDGRWSGECEFMADLIPPNPPASISSVAYPTYNPGNPNLPGSGGVGIAGSITIKPPTSGATDVTGYAYTLDSGVQAAAAPRVTPSSGGAATVTIVPPRDGLNTLRVWSTDRAGWFSSMVTYQFKVASGNGPAAQWVFDDVSVVGSDDTGHGNTLTLSGATSTTGRGGVGTALSLAAANAHAYRANGVQTPHPQTGAPLTVRTDSTFTVAAWARLNSTVGPDQQAVIGMDSTSSSPFAISHIPGSNNWRFAMANSDTATTSLATVHSTATATAGRWTHLAGVYDVSTKQLRLYVDGVLQPNTATLTAGFHGTGPWTVGRRRYGGVNDSYFKGAIDDVRIYNYAVPVAEIQQMARPLSPQVTFPGGATATVGDQVQVRFDAGGDVNVTQFRYSVGTDTLDLSATPTTPGGTATVNITAVSVGELRVFAAGRNTATGANGLSQSAAIEVMAAAGLTGTVVDNTTEQPAVGVAVRLEPVGLSATTDAGGAFSFPGLTPGDYLVAASVGGGCGLAASTEIEILNATVIELRLDPVTDAYGYGCQVVTQTYTPANGSAIALAGDDAVSQVGLPFAFPFYGNSYSTAWVDTNGIVTFVDPVGSHPGDSVNIPSPAQPNAMIAAFWDDIVVDGSASVHTGTVGIPPIRQHSIEWRNVHLAGNASQRINAKVTLFESGRIILNYSGIDQSSPAERGESATVGIESPGGNSGLEYSFSSPTLADSQAVVFLTPLVGNPIQAFDLAGTVTDAVTGDPDPGAIVTLEPAGITVTADPAGNYEFPHVEQGVYTVSAESGSNCGRLLDVEVDLYDQAEIDLPLQPLTDAVGNACRSEPVTFVPANGTVLPLTGDDGRTQVTSPFPIEFYGQQYTTIWVDIDGVASFQNYAGVPWQSMPLPSPAAGNEPNGAVYPFWDDWVVDSSASVRTDTIGSAPNRRFVIEWRNVRSEAEPTVRVSFEVIFHESGDIVVAWDGIGATPRAQGAQGAVAIENTDGSVALVHSFHEAVLRSGEGVRFTAGPEPIGDVRGTVECAGVPASDVTVTVAGESTATDADGRFTFAGLPGGSYTVLATPASGACYGTSAEPVTVFGNDTSIVDFALQNSTGTRYAVTDGPRAYVPANGAVLPLTGDDGIHQIQNLPFPVTLYGQQFTTAWVQNDGVVSFEAPNGHAWDPNPIPQPAAVGRPDATVYPFWHDWVVDQAASVRTETIGSAPNRRFVIEWRNVVSLNDSSARVSFATILHENGDIEIVWDDIDVNFYEQGGYATTGVENAGGTVAVQYSYHHPVIVSGHGVLFQPVTS
ncbi:LamG-like jellyroll fold domain-containing protein [Micromonospora sp. LOL_023]|uniref:LamG-like jellyroll fold domain-containing protein n=1 Tax=Micromonospora sp. LOL_023 TaxID=3345418 RepID=UPI003A8C8690